MIPLPSAIKVIEEKDNRAVFEVQGLYPGYGVTLGSSLRRVILSSLEGAAITEVKIKGVSHEFSTLSGVLEDVIVLLLNLKKLRFKLFSEEPQTAVLSIKGEKEVKGKDFKLSSQTKLSNPEEHIASLTKSTAELQIEALVEKGMGFSSIESRQKAKAEVGVIPLDASFSPVRKVSLRVDNMRVGERTDFDRLTVELETDGTISAKEAVKRSSDILLEHFSLIAKSLSAPKPKEKSKEEPSGKESKKPAKEKKADFKKLKIDDLDISERTKNILLNNKLKTVGGLLRKSEDNLNVLEGMGPKGVEEIVEGLKKLKLELKK